MLRTTVMLPADLRLRAQAFAKARGISFGQFVREALDAFLQPADSQVREDPFLADDALYDGPSPPSFSADHDEHLYGDSET